MSTFEWTRRRWLYCSLLPIASHTLRADNDAPDKWQSWAGARRQKPRLFNPALLIPLLCKNLQARLVHAHTEPLHTATFTMVISPSRFELCVGYARYIPASMYKVRLIERLALRRHPKSPRNGELIECLTRELLHSAHTRRPKEPRSFCLAEGIVNSGILNQLTLFSPAATWYCGWAPRRHWAFADKAGEHGQLHRHYREACMAQFSNLSFEPHTSADVLKYLP